MSTEFYNRNWRMPNSWNGSTDNNNKVSNYSMSFDGIDEIINLGTSSTLELKNNFTISLWIKASESVGSARGILVCGDYGSSQGYRIYKTSTHKVAFNTTARTATSTTNIDTGDWFHVLAIFESNTGGNRRLRIYVNGNLEGTQTALPYEPTYTGTIYKQVAYPYNATGNEFAGNIDHLAIFDYALTDGTGGTVNQIAELYGNSTNGVGNAMSLSAKPKAFYAIGDYAAFNGSEYLVNNGALSDYVFDFAPNDYVDCGNDSSLNPSSELSVSVWAKLDGTGTGTFPCVISNVSSTTNNGGFAIVESSSKWTIYLDTTGSSGWVNIQSDNNIINGQWYHLCITWNGSTVILYVNGVAQSTTVSASQIVYNADTKTMIGRYSSDYFQGKISNVQVFDVALDATGSNSVETLYNNGTPLSSMSGFTSLQGWWKLDASATFNSLTSTWSIPDDSSNSNTGTSNNMNAANLIQSDLLITQPYSRFALNFDGTNDYITVPSTSDFAFGTNGYSISFWFNGSGTNNSSGFGVNIFDMRAAVTFAAPSLWIQTKGTSSLVKLYINGAYLVSTTATINADEWYHILVTNDGTTSKIFLNGNTTPIGTGADSTNYVAAPLKIGGYYQNNTYNYSGLVSNFSIWNAALTAAQITELYNSAKPSNLNSFSAYSNLVSWWQLGENMSYVGSGAQGTGGTEWTVLDEKGSNNGEGTNLGPAEDSIVNGVGTSGNGLSDGMGGADNIIGDAPYSTANAVSYGMGVDARVSGSGNVPS